MAEGLVYGPDEGWLMEGSSGGLLRLGGIPLGSSELWMPPPLRVIVSAHESPFLNYFALGWKTGFIGGCRWPRFIFVALSSY